MNYYAIHLYLDLNFETIEVFWENGRHLPTYCGGSVYPIIGITRFLCLTSFIYNNEGCNILRFIANTVL